MDRDGPRPPVDWRIWEWIPDVYARFSFRQARAFRVLSLGIAYLLCVGALTREPSFDRALTVDMNAPVADQEIRAAFFFESVDVERTREARKAAADAVPTHYRVDGALVAEQVRKLRDRLGLVQQARPDVERAVVELFRNSTSADTDADLVGRAVARVVETWRKKDEWKALADPDLLKPLLTPDRSSLPRRVFEPESAPATGAGATGSVVTPRKTVALDPDPPLPLTFAEADRLITLAADALESVLNQGVRPATLPAGAESSRIVILQPEPAAVTRAGTSATETTLGQLNDPGKAEAVLKENLSSLLRQQAGAGGTDTLSTQWAGALDAVVALSRDLVVPVLVEDKVATAVAQARASESTPPVMKEIEAGEIIQDRGRRWTTQSREDVKTYLKLLASNNRPWQQFTGTLLANALLTALTFLAWRHLTSFVGRVPALVGCVGMTPDKSFALGVALITMLLITARVFLYFEPSGYMVPAAAAAILFAILGGPIRASMLSVLSALLVSDLFQYNWRLMLVLGAMACAGGFAVTRVRRRGDMTAAAVAATLAGIAASVAVTLSMESLLSENFLRRMGLIILNGGLCAVVVPGLLSPLERLFRITTDITLLEYSDLNNPLLGELAMRAPATHAHSLMMGQLAEAAADAIGANGLLARVCAYYHDIGKMSRSELFVENQEGTNIHDQLKPEESAALIRQHVLDGAEMARRYRLPEPLVDGILEHHGTTVIAFFYAKAVKLYGEDHVDPADYRYPGPRPRRPETAILMICDAVESSARTLEKPTPESVRALVRKFVDQRLAEGQFDDCDLTMKQLTSVVDVLARSLLSMMHARLKYPTLPPVARRES
ncbi:MAG: HDIG domain-containing protein [Candidatus Hydrogenedentes bacterium]|nr:HDIG domain-containing protein [Candidatus Hydrogenedentota bacterium]